MTAPGKSINDRTRKAGLRWPMETYNDCLKRRQTKPYCCRGSGNRRAMGRGASGLPVTRREKTADWLHAVLHKIEGDESNSRYWYRRSGQNYESWGDPQEELKAIKAVLTY